MKRSILICLLVFFALGNVLGQEAHHDAEHDDLWPHSLGIMVGYSWIPQTINEQGDVQVTVNPTLGLDYGYFFSHHFGLGLVNDVEFARYLVQNPEGNPIVRENKYIGALVAIYEPIPSIGFFAGPGIEVDKHQSFALVKIGAEVAKRFEDGWGVGVNASIDINEVYNTIAAGVIIFKRFPGKGKQN